MNFGTEDDCRSEGTHAKKVTTEDVHKSNSRGTQDFVKSRQILAARVLNTIKILRVFYEAISTVIDQEGDGYGDSESLLLPQAKRQKRSCGVKFGSDCQQMWNGGCDGKFRDASSRAESKSRFTGEIQRSGGSIADDQDDLVSSLRSLVSVLRSHEETEQIWRIKLQALREQKEALNFEKQHYKQKRKRQRGDSCVGLNIEEGNEGLSYAGP